MENFPDNFYFRSMIDNMQRPNPPGEVVEDLSQHNKTGEVVEGRRQHDEAGEDVEDIPQHDESSCDTCDVCESRVEVESLCLVCNMWLCHACTNTHRKVPATRQHKLQSNRDICQECTTLVMLKKAQVLKTNHVLGEISDSLTQETVRLEREKQEIKDEILAKAKQAHDAIDLQVKDLTDRVDDLYRGHTCHRGREVSEQVALVDKLKSSNENVLSLLEEMRTSQDGRTSRMLLKTLEGHLIDQSTLQQLTQTHPGHFSVFFDDKTSWLNIGEILEGWSTLA